MNVWYLVYKVIIDDIIFYPPVYQFLIIPGLIAALLVALFIIWFERKAAAFVQMRYGPWEIAPKIGGAIQLVADLTRYALQEIIVPETVDQLPYILSPIVMIILSLMPLEAIPLTSVKPYFPIPMGYSLLIAVAISTLSPLFVIIMSWASNNKFSLVGGVRESFIITAYELIAVLGFLTVAAMTHTFNMVSIVNTQMSGKWLGLLNPIALLVVFIAILMSTSGFPFEIPDSESEIVAGPYTEYTGLLYGLNMGGAYIRRWVFSVLMVLVFLGGWAPYHPTPGIITGYFVPSLIVSIKALIVMAIMSFLRTVYGRYRMDQALGIAWEILIPLALVAFGIGLAEAYFGIII
ncbi:MAG: NADH-quinone oxidoreductase subunit NuoH [Caldisphaera sp.]|jgi:NADH-quinone oxidoreductase subunit H|nr:NADH-quinone oxidoreductase subunit NuoH [Caldisphaera sp.]PMP61075.1 MAG: NADH-quinone oxidoreductase subunit NuoH [Caldisphaera sp.]